MANGCLDVYVSVYRKDIFLHLFMGGDVDDIHSSKIYWWRFRDETTTANQVVIGTLYHLAK